ncbi:MAG: type IV pilus assembly protein PilM [Candidatus Aureabacteria bacterium]|nr:type IV pilus assembly protein PilM [Candidatus Auribacterota bacterium]
MFRKEKNSQQLEVNAGEEKRKLDSFFVLQRRKGLVFIRREMVGVDIGSSHIKVVQIDLKKSPPVVRGIHVEEIPIDKRDRGEVTEVFIIKKLKNIVRKAKLMNCLAVSFVSGSSVYIHSCSLPEMPENDIEEALKADVAREIPFSVEESIVGYNIVGRTTGRRGQELEIAAVFAHKEVVNRKIWLLEQSGLQSAGMTVLPFSYENILFSKLEETPEHAVIITIGEETTGIDFFRNGSFLFTREVSASGKDVNKSLTGAVTLPDKKIEISLEEAEVIKREYGIVQEQSDYKDNPVLTQLIARSRSVYEKMATEIKRSLGYFARMAKISEIESVFVSGGGASTKNLLPFLREQLGTPVEIFPFEKYFQLSPSVKQKLKGHESIFSFILPACGLALEQPNLKINLVPRVTRTVSRIASFKSVYNFALVVLYVIAISLFLKIKKDTQYYEGILSDLKNNFKNVSEHNQQVLVFQSYRQKVQTKKAVLESLVGNRPLWHGVLKEISQITPRNVYLQQVYFELDRETGNIEVTISGEVQRDIKSVDYTVSKFSLDMKNSPYFTNVNLENTKTSFSGGRSQTLFSIRSMLMY